MCVACGRGREVDVAGECARERMRKGAGGQALEASVRTPPLREMGDAAGFKPRNNSLTCVMKASFLLC